jgi:hypothetical protein
MHANDDSQFQATGQMKVNDLDKSCWYVLFFFFSGRFPDNVQLENQSIKKRSAKLASHKYGRCYQFLYCCGRRYHHMNRTVTSNFAMSMVAHT